MSLSPERLREAAYTLTTYLGSKEPGIEFDPPSPFSTRRARLQRRSSSTSLSHRAGSNSNRKEGGQPGSSGPGLRPGQLDAEGALKPLTILELGSGMGITIAKLAEIISGQNANDAPIG